MGGQAVGAKLDDIEFVIFEFQANMNKLWRYVGYDFDIFIEVNNIPIPLSLSALSSFVNKGIMKTYVHDMWSILMIWFLGAKEGWVGGLELSAQGR